MPILPQIISTIFLISLVIGISTGNCIVGKFVPIEDNKMHAPTNNYAQNQPGEANKLIVTGGTTKYSITLKEGNNKCTAPNDGQEVECQLSGKKMTGELIFSFSNGMEIEVPFKEVPFFAGNKCQINLVDYNRGTHETIIEINGVKVKIVLDEENKIPIQACKGVN
ncbi:unnamed protein product [Meloidogyne enterolobii]|uniref:Uncharacterized protein n=3 Tax=Meloidogyne enterolobii TaxID=390850 RepID=A0ACB1ATW4_MELEN|nr:unnamed protein product [Meloidogyne enterolobii]